MFIRKHLLGIQLAYCWEAPGEGTERFIGRHKPDRIHLRSVALEICAMRNIVLIACLSLLHCGVCQSQTAANPTDLPEEETQSRARAGCAPNPGSLRAVSDQKGFATHLDVSPRAADDPPDAPSAHAVSAATASSDLPEAPSVASRGPNRTDGIRDGGTRFMPPTLAMERNTNRNWHTLDSKFILLHTFSTLALIADIVTTAHGLAAQPNAIELNPLLGERPTLARIVGTTVPLHAFSFYLSYRAKKLAPRRNVWMFIPKLSIAAHTAATINNLIVAH
jgi:hypothetical protein